MKLLNIFKGNKEVASNNIDKNRPLVKEGFILLGATGIDWVAVKYALNAHYGIKTNDWSWPDDELIFIEQGVHVVAQYINKPYTSEKLMQDVKNSLWPQAVEIVAKHKAYIKIIVKSCNKPYNVGSLYTGLAASFLELPNAIAIYHIEKIVSPEMFLNAAGGMGNIGTTAGVFRKSEVLQYNPGLFRNSEDNEK